MQAEQKHIQWEHSYVAADKTFCIYLADNEALVHEHARRSGFPATRVTEITKMIDPTTAVSCSERPCQRLFAVLRLEP